jgi:hypothetical protein
VTELGGFATLVLGATDADQVGCGAPVLVLAGTPRVATALTLALEPPPAAMAVTSGVVILLLTTGASPASATPGSALTAAFEAVAVTLPSTPIAFAPLDAAHVVPLDVATALAAMLPASGQPRGLSPQ